jgi:hypothetical protein
VQLFGGWQTPLVCTEPHERAAGEDDAASDEEAEAPAAPEVEPAADDLAAAAKPGELLPSVASIRDWTDDEGEPLVVDLPNSSAAGSSTLGRLKRRMLGDKDAAGAGSSSARPALRKKSRKMPVASG